MEKAESVATVGKYADLKDPGIRAFLLAGEQFYPPDAVNFSLAQQRDFYDRYCAHFRKPRPFGLAVQDYQVGPVLCRRYTPRKAHGANLLYLHGGGFILGGLESHDDVVAELAAGAEVMAFAVAYRLAPEHPFPAALDDCWSVLKDLTRQRWPVVLAGDSAGGNLAAALCLRARDEDPALLSLIKGQILIYPGLGGDVSKGSYLKQAHAPGLSTSDVLYYRDIYKGAPHPYAEPLKATSHVGLPPALLVAAGLDPLHDDCVHYAQKLREASVAAEIREEPLLVHAFLRARHMSEPAAESFAAIVAALRRFAA
jgi:acetyl esterase